MRRRARVPTRLVLAAALPGALAATLATAPALGAQDAPDTVALAALQEAAVALDPRLAQRELEGRAAALRLANLDAARRPRLGFSGFASHQSEVTEIPVSQPGFQIAAPPKDRWEAAARTEWLLWDGGRLGARADVETARRDAALAELDARLHTVRTEVAEAYYSALLVQERLAEVDGLLEDLEARLTEVRARVRAGAALPGDTAVVRAELLGARQRADALEADRRAALDVLSDRTGRALGPGHVLSLPDLEAALAALPPALLRPGDPGADSALAATRVHPRHRAFEAQREQLLRQARAVAAERRPTISGFGALAFGAPGYAQFEETPHEYWQAGVRVEWRPWDWGTRARERELLEVRSRIVETEARAFDDALLRALQRPLRAAEQARAALATDDQIVALREQVVRQATAQLAERAIPPSVWTDARTDLAEARTARLRHRVELARARTEILLLLGSELPGS